MIHRKARVCAVLQRSPEAEAGLLPAALPHRRNLLARFVVASPIHTSLPRARLEKRFKAADCCTLIWERGLQK